MFTQLQVGLDTFIPVKGQCYVKFTFFLLFLLPSVSERPRNRSIKNSNKKTFLSSCKFLEFLVSHQLTAVKKTFLTTGWSGLRNGFTNGG